MNKARRPRKPARPQPYRNPKERILVVSEGLTEKEYIESYVRFQRNDLVSHISIKSQVGVPMSVVREAKKLMLDALKRAKNESDENLKFDSVWVVFDVDDHPCVGEAKVMARDNNIRCAVSNPCFELWLYLHFANPPGLEHRSRIVSLLRLYDPTYDKHVDFERYRSGISVAMTRAKKLDNAANLDEESGRNPTSGMWQLLKKIDDNGKE